MTDEQKQGHAATTPVITTEWGTAQYGLLHVASAERVGCTEDQAIAASDAERSKCTPIVRYTTVINDRVFSTEWLRIPTKKQREEHPNWPESVVLS